MQNFSDQLLTSGEELVDVDVRLGRRKMMLRHSILDGTVRLGPSRAGDARDIFLALETVVFETATATKTFSQWLADVTQARAGDTTITTERHVDSVRITTVRSRATCLI